MARSSITGAERAPAQAPGRDVEALGPSDTSDSGSDVQGELDLASPLDLDKDRFGAVQPGLESDSDAAGTGERGSALLDEEAREGADILPDDVRSLTGVAEDAEDAEDVAADAELEFAELTDADVDALAAPDDDEDDDDGAH